MARCHCIIAHATNDEERKKVTQALEYARSVGDSVGIMLALARLGHCPRATTPATPAEIEHA